MTRIASDRISDPFDARFDVGVENGALHVARAGPSPDGSDHVVLAIHGVTASLMTWRSIARRLPSYACATLLAPDLRGRGRSATLPPPYGLTTHVDDLLAVLDHVGAEKAVLVGHSLGAYVAARLAVEHPERVAGLVLLDAGLPLPAPEDPDHLVHTAVQNAIMRLSITFPTEDAYVNAWRSHPAFAQAWNEDVREYAHYDLIEDKDDGVRCIASPSAVRTDSIEMVRDNKTRNALDHVRCQERVHVLRAERGLFDDSEDPVVPLSDLESYAAKHPEAHVENVIGVNHYTLVMGNSPGPDKVAAVIDAACSA